MAVRVPDIDASIRDFTARLAEAIEAQVRERVLSAMASVFYPPAPPLASKLTQRKPGRRSAPKARRAPRLSAEALAVRRLQGQYLGALRGLPPAARARVKKLAREKGVAAAVKLAVSLR
ncbi:MAG: hypothetical protein JXQ75_01030 [Phycisphaerae bacterium]|jgi:hypothetical protein|nr:hypothetical protein [Phycisphaerae bacterium]